MMKDYSFLRDLQDALRAPCSDAERAQSDWDPDAATVNLNKSSCYSCGCSVPAGDGVAFASVNKSTGWLVTCLSYDCVPSHFKDVFFEGVPSQSITPPWFVVEAEAPVLELGDPVWVGGSFTAPSVAPSKWTVTSMNKLYDSGDLSMYGQSSPERLRKFSAL